jgi:hypothetical protein
LEGGDLGGSWFETSPGKKVSETSYHKTKEKWDVVKHNYNPSYEGSISRRIEIQAGQSKNMRPNLKNNQSRKCGGCGSSDRVPSV